MRKGKFCWKWKSEEFDHSKPWRNKPSFLKLVKVTILQFLLKSQETSLESRDRGSGRTESYIKSDSIPGLQGWIENELHVQQNNWQI